MEQTYTTQMAGAASRQTQVEEQFGRLENSLAELEKNISHLLDRISPISRGLPPSAPEPSNKVAEALVPMAERIRRFNDHVRTLAVMVNSGLERLEI